MKNNRLTFILMFIIILILAGLCYLFATDKIIINNDNNTVNKENANIKENSNSKGNEQDNNLKGQEEKADTIYGVYSYTKNYYDSFAQVQRTINCQLKLNEDGSATLEYSDGSIYDSTYGSFVKKDDKIIYTAKYDFYDNIKTIKDEEEITEFDIVNTNKLKSDYFNLTLEKQN